jgi:hypothetical protein
MFAGGILASKSASPLVRQGLKPLAQSSSRLKLTSCTIVNYLFRNGQDARSTIKLSFVERASCPLLRIVQDIS